MHLHEQIENWQNFLTTILEEVHSIYKNDMHKLNMWKNMFFLITKTKLKKLLKKIHTSQVLINK